MAICHKFINNFCSLIHNRLCLIRYLNSAKIISFQTFLNNFLSIDSTTVIIVCVLVGKFAVSFTFNAIYVITSESYPTVIRNTAVSICACFSRIGGTLSPYVQLLVIIFRLFYYFKFVYLLTLL